MRVLIVGLLVLALGVAGVSTYLIQRFSGEEKLDELNKQAKAKTFKVLVATKPIASGSKIILDVVAWQGWEEKSLNKKFIVVDDEKQQKKRLDQFIGSIARRDIMVGEPILAEKLFKRQGAGFMAGAIQEGMRAVSIKVTAATATSGFVFPGDSVDIILTHNKASEAVKKTRAKG
jgi:pilus assembly protein CpaB